MRHHPHALVYPARIDEERPQCEVRIPNAWRDRVGVIVRPGNGKGGRPGRGVTPGGSCDDPGRHIGVVGQHANTNGREPQPCHAAGVGR